jgi:hypothetical protein
MLHYTRCCQYHKILSSIRRWCAMLSHSLPARSLSGRAASLKTLPEGAGSRRPERLISLAFLAISPAISGVGSIFLPALRETARGRPQEAGALASAFAPRTVRGGDPSRIRPRAVAAGRRPARRTHRALLARATRRRAQCRQITGDAGGVDAEIAAPHSRGGAQIDAAAEARRSYADYDVVGETKPAAPVASLDPAGCRARSP